MATERRQQALLAALLVVLAIVLYRMWAATSAGPAPASNATGAAAAAQPAGGAQTPTAPDVHLGALGGKHPRPVGPERNLFRFKPKAPPPPPPAPAPPPATAPVQAPSVPGQPPPPPPINLKFIGLIEQSGGKPKLAVLSDGIGPPFTASEGQNVAGRYKVLRIGAESIEMSYLDGRGRQTIRLTGGP
jgi:hypothetical protein